MTAVRVLYLVPRSHEASPEARVEAKHSGVSLAIKSFEAVAQFGLEIADIGLSQPANCSLPSHERDPNRWCWT